MAARRNMTLAVKRLIRDVASRLPELAHVRPSRILVVAGEARGTSRATIRAGHLRRRGGGERRFLRVRGRRVFYVITLRPLWFAASTPEERIATILHELYHVSKRFDGTLHRGRRHEKLPRAAFDRKVRALLARYLEAAPADIVESFDGEGIVRVTLWLRVPRRTSGAALDCDEHLLQGFMPLRTRPAHPERRTLRPRTTRRVVRGQDEEEGST
jgi:predicted metallopeptidase